jgi:hypothetical protein
LGLSETSSSQFSSIKLPRVQLLQTEDKNHQQLPGKFRFY